jgi:hypothetical protein
VAGIAIAKYVTTNTNYGGPEKQEMPTRKSGLRNPAPSPQKTATENRTAFGMRAVAMN